MVSKVSNNDSDSVVKVLLIEGFCSVPWMEKQLGRAAGIVRLEHNSEDEDHKDWSVVEPAWKNIELKRIDCYVRKKDFTRTLNVDKVEECKAEIATGMYHGVVVADLTRDCDKFEQHLGSTIEAFAKDGGVVAFPTTEFRLIPTLNKLFSTKYIQGDYLHTAWEPSLENAEVVAKSFARGGIWTPEQVLKESAFESSCVSLMNVPPEERCFGVAAVERSKMMNPMLGGSANEECVTVASDSEKKSNDEGYPVCVAVHNYGQGCVGYFGDQGCVETTLRLLAGLLTSRAPKVTVDSFSKLNESTFKRVLSAKDKGNSCFASGEFADAITCYDEALSLFGEKAGKKGAQRNVHVTLWSNRAECCFRLKQYDKAEEACTKALEIDANHSKSILRRAKARLYLSQNNTLHEVRLLEQAECDVRKLAFYPEEECKSSSELLELIQPRLKAAKKKQKNSFKAGFSSALSSN